MKSIIAELPKPAIGKSWKRPRHCVLHAYVDDMWPRKATGKPLVPFDQYFLQSNHKADLIHVMRLRRGTNLKDSLEYSHRPFRRLQGLAFMSGVFNDPGA